MSKSNEKRLLKSLDKAANLSRAGMDPNLVLTKVAKEFQLTPQEICRVSETYNKAKSVAFLKKASSENRAGDFPLADSKTIIQGIYGTVEKQASDGSFSMRNYSTTRSYTVLEKTATEEKKTVPRVSSCERDPGSVFKEATEFTYLSRQIQSDMFNKYASERDNLETAIRKVAEYCQVAPEKDLKKTARLIVNAHGEQGVKFINDVNKRMFKECLPVVEKTAHAAVFPACEPFISVANAFEHGKNLVKTSRDIDSFDKQADADLLSLIGAGVPQGKAKTKAPEQEGFVDPQTGMSPVWDNYLKDLQAKKTLYTLYRFDPIIKSYPFEDVIDMYNEVADTTPSLANNKAWMRASMRRMLTQGKAADPFELKDMMQAETARTGSQKQHVDMMSSIYGDKKSKPAEPRTEENKTTNVSIPVSQLAGKNDN